MAHQLGLQHRDGEWTERTVKSTDRMVVVAEERGGRQLRQADISHLQNTPVKCTRFLRETVLQVLFRSHFGTLDFVQCTRVYTRLQVTPSVDPFQRPQSLLSCFFTPDYQRANLAGFHSVFVQMLKLFGDCNSKSNRYPCYFSKLVHDIHKCAVG